MIFYQHQILAKFLIKIHPASSIIKREIFGTQASLFYLNLLLGTLEYFKTSMALKCIFQPIMSLLWQFSQCLLPLTFYIRDRFQFSPSPISRENLSNFALVITLMVVLHYICAKIFSVVARDAILAICKWVNVVRKNALTRMYRLFINRNQIFFEIMWSVEGSIIREKVEHNKIKRSDP